MQTACSTSKCYDIGSEARNGSLLRERDPLMMYISLVQVTQTMAQSFTISTARQNFFALFQTVTGHRGRKVVITSRGSERHAVLVGESYLNELEAAAKRLRDIEAGKAHPASNFKLIGSGRVAEAGDDPLDDIRLDDNALSERKLVSFEG